MECRLFDTRRYKHLRYATNIGRCTANVHTYHTRERFATRIVFITVSHNDMSYLDFKSDQSRKSKFSRKEEKLLFNLTENN